MRATRLPPSQLEPSPYRHQHFLLSRGARHFSIAAGTPPPPLLLGACAPRNGSRLARADAFATFPKARGAPPPRASLARSRSLEPQALREDVSRTERHRRPFRCSSVANSFQCHQERCDVVDVLVAVDAQQLAMSLQRIADRHFRRVAFRAKRSVRPVGCYQRHVEIVDPLKLPFDR